MNATHHLRVLIANQRRDRLDRLAKVVRDLGHEVIVSEIHVADVAADTSRERPDVALVGVGESSEHALELISEIVRCAFCPVIALLESYDGAWIDQAAQRGVYAYIIGSRAEDLQSAIDITLRRYAEFQEARGGFERGDAETQRALGQTVGRKRHVLELHDGVVQALSVAQLALDLERPAESREAILQALENARTIVTHAIEELEGDGVPLDQLVRDAAPR